MRRQVGRQPTVLRRVERVEAGLLAAHEGREAAVRGVEVEEGGGLVGGVGERVDDVRRHGQPLAGADDERLEVGADAIRQLAGEHVEGVGVLAVDVGVGAGLAGRVLRPRDRELGAGLEQADVLAGRGADVLAGTWRSGHRRPNATVAAVRRTVAVLLLVLATPAHAGVWDQAVAHARAYAQGRAGSVAFALIDDSGRMRGYREHAAWYSAS